MGLLTRSASLGEAGDQPINPHQIAECLPVATTTRLLVAHANALGAAVPITVTNGGSCHVAAAALPWATLSGAAECPGPPQRGGQHQFRQRRTAATALGRPVSGQGDTPLRGRIELPTEHRHGVRASVKLKPCRPARCQSSPTICTALCSGSPTNSARFEPERTKSTADPECAGRRLPVAAAAILTRAGLSLTRPHDRSGPIAIIAEVRDDELDLAGGRCNDSATQGDRLRTQVRTPSGIQSDSQITSLSLGHVIHLRMMLC